MIDNHAIQAKVSTPSPGDSKSPGEGVLFILIFRQSGWQKVQWHQIVHPRKWINLGLVVPIDQVIDGKPQRGKNGHDNSQIPVVDALFGENGVDSIGEQEEQQPDQVV